MQEQLDGWRLRFNHDVTRRANSVLAEQIGALTLAEKIVAVEAFYAQYKTKARFQLCPASQPTVLAETLLGRGYQVESGAEVQFAPVQDILRLARYLPTQLSDRPDTEWLELYEQVEQADPHKRQVREQMFYQIRPRHVFASARLNGRCAAVGLAVAEGRYAGIFNMATHPEYRRQGAATAVLAALADWAAGQQVTSLYLQVASNNEVAKSAYAKAGFRALYSYDYYEASC